MVEKFDKTLKHLTSYPDLYEFLSERPRTEEEFEKFLSLRRKETAVRVFMANLRKKQTGLIVLKNHYVSIDEMLARLVVDQLSELFHLDDFNPEVHSLLVKLKDAEEERDLAVAKVQQLQDEIKKVNQSEIQKMDFLRKYISQNILYPESVSTSKASEKDKMSMFDMMFEDDVCVCLDIPRETKRESYYQSEIKDEQELTEENYKSRAMKRILTDLFMELKRDYLKKMNSFEKEHGILKKKEKDDKDEKSQIDAYLEQIRRNRLKSIQSIVGNKELTNQEKLALYAFYSDYHNTDMEELINFAGDYNVNANLLIDILETPTNEYDCENVKNMLRQFAKPSEYHQMKRFARELLEGKWYITADYRGKETVFQLVPVDEINEIREILGLKPVKTNVKKEQEQTKDSDKKKNETKKQVKSEIQIQRFNMNDGIDVEPPEYPVEE